jgi:hypothetical protein
MENDEIIMENDFKFTEEYIQRKLNGFFAMNTPKYVLENLYVFRWESDKFIETKSGLIYEVEIKVSRSDYKNDFKNKKDKHVILEGKEEHIPSYEEYKERFKHYGSDINDKYYRTENFKKPNFFYYAVPEGMIDVSEVPEYAGLIYVLPEGKRDTKDGNFCWDGFYVVKNAPKLHSEKYADDELKLSEKFYYNMLSWKEKCREEKERRLLTEDKDHKIPYAELYEKYEKLTKENAALKALADSESKNAQLFAATMQDDYRIIRGYREKVCELSPGFDFIKFEDQFLEDYK